MIFHKARGISSPATQPQTS